MVAENRKTSELRHLSRLCTALLRDKDEKSNELASAITQAQTAASAFGHSITAKGAETSASVLNMFDGPPSHAPRPAMGESVLMGGGGGAVGRRPSSSHIIGSSQSSQIRHSQSVGDIGLMARLGGNNAFTPNGIPRPGSRSGRPGSRGGGNSSSQHLLTELDNSGGSQKVFGGTGGGFLPTKGWVGGQRGVVGLPGL